MTKTYAVDIIGVSRFLYSDDGVKFLKNQIRSLPLLEDESTSVVALRSAIIADSIDGEISSANIMAELPWTSVWLTPAAFYDGVRTSVPQTITKETPSALLCTPGTCSCLPAPRQLRAARARTSRRSRPSPLVIRL